MIRMQNRDLQTDFLQRVQQSIGRYQPMLEREFGVSLGNVQARPLVVREFLEAIIHQARTRLHTSSSPRANLSRCLFELERRAIWLPATAFLYIRFWLPQLMMKWSEPPPLILVSFLGWKHTDFEKNRSRIEPWAVHELAHGVWQRLAPRNEPRNRDWWLWN